MARLRRDEATAPLALPRFATAHQTKIGSTHWSGRPRRSGSRHVHRTPRPAIGGPFAELHIGWWINPRWAISYEAWAFVGQTDPLGEVRVSGLGLATVTKRIAARTWVKAGAGLALHQSSNELVDELTGMTSRLELRGVGLGAGLDHELIQRGAIAIDASVRVGASIFPDHGGGGMAALASASPGIDRRNAHREAEPQVIDRRGIDRKSVV